MGKSKTVDEPTACNSVAEVSKFLQLSYVWVHWAGSIQDMLRPTSSPVEGELVLKLLRFRTRLTALKSTVWGRDSQCHLLPSPGNQMLLLPSTDPRGGGSAKMKMC